MTLLARIESATGPDREIDAEIWERIGLTEGHERHCRDWCRRHKLPRARYLNAWSPAFTGSVDAALTLVPDGLWIEITDMQNGLVASHATIFGPSSVFGSSPDVKGYGQHLPGQRALAICAAAEQFLDDMVGEPKL